MVDKINVDKYTVEIGTTEDNEFVFRALRYNEPWIDKLTMTDGSNLIMAMAYEIQRLSRELELSSDAHILSNISGMNYRYSKDAIATAVNAYEMK